MKVLYYGNVVNYAFSFAITLRTAGHKDIYALIEDDDLYTPDFLTEDNSQNLPFIYLEKEGRVIEDLRGRKYDSCAFMSGFDIVHCFSATTAIYCYELRVPYIYRNVGCFSDLYRWYDPRRSWFGLASIKDWVFTWKFRNMVRSSKAVIGSLGCDLTEMEDFISLSDKRNYAFPIPYFAFSLSLEKDKVDLEKFDAKTLQVFSTSATESGRTIILMPARHNWPLKGQPLMFDALVEISRSYESVTIVCVEWGPHVQRSKDYIHSVGLSDQVIWIPRLTSSELQRCLVRSSCCLIEFRQGISGGYGGCALDALLAGCPAVTQACPIDAIRVFRSPAPIFDATCEVSSIVNSLEAALRVPSSSRAAYAAESNNWLDVECGVQLLSHYTNIYEEVVSG